MADDQKNDVAKREEAIQAFWKEREIFEKSLKKDAPQGEFVFYDGPPFATGTPHSGSLLSSVSKDLIPRYKTMRGYRVRRRWGWDCHGLPIESLVEKKLGLKNKKEIYAIGIEKFNETARGMVLEYVHEWKRYVERVGRFVDFDNSYKTMDPTYMESVWWALKEVHKKGHLYEGRKVLLYCPHCETPLAKAEIAMDNTYKDVTEEAVTVKFKIKDPQKHGLPENTYFLAWTTTPWTLPGNVALAVGSNISYGLYEKEGETLILARERAGTYNLSAPLRETEGSELVGIEYEPLFETEKVKAHPSEKKWTVLPADFVTTDEGTGIVHTAVIYGEDDYNLGLKESLPMVPLLNPNATYNDDAPEFLRGKYIKKAEAEIKTDLESHGLLFEKKPHTHSYPHCYRCGTALIYNAVSSWFINMQAVKAKLLSENEKITWFPEHLKHGRFQNILENAPDWTISRNRFWATPLPIWKDSKGGVTVLGSLDELKAHTKKSGNRYFVMRHGESEKNVRGVISQDVGDGMRLTEKGRRDARRAADAFRGKIDLIITSELDRARETSAIVQEMCGLGDAAVIADKRLNEYDHGSLNGHTDTEWAERFPSASYVYEEDPAGGEGVRRMMRRVADLLYEIEKGYQGKNILLISHGYPISAAMAAAQGGSKETIIRICDKEELAPGSIRPLDFIPLPHNGNYELDYHLPYIDRIDVVDENGEPLTRIPEVVDCWVESGAMPFAEYHYPFENRAAFEKRSPGDFVSEYIGQTRAWFYYMHAVSVQLFGTRSFKNVITTGNVLAEDGEKLSKSKQNYTDPYDLFHRFGADAFRYYIMSSVVMQAEDLTFRDDDVKEVYARVVNLLRNTHAFYLLYADELRPGQVSKSPHVLDRWILARLDETVRAATEAFDRYDVVHATRPMRDFVDDFSTWYVRRSRDRVKGTDEPDKQHGLFTMRTVFHTFSRAIAPVMPFIAEEIFQTVRSDTDAESVHLAPWPAAENAGGSRLSRIFATADPDSGLIEKMVEVRKVVSLALEARQKANIKVRQPLARLSITQNIPEELKAVLAEEINVKEVIAGAKEFSLDTVLTPQLRKEGELRDLVREVQDLRKAAGLEAKDKAVLIVSPQKSEVVAMHWEELARAANLSGKEEGQTFNVRA